MPNAAEDNVLRATTTVAPVRTVAATRSRAMEGAGERASASRTVRPCTRSNGGPSRILRRLAFESVKAAEIAAQLGPSHARRAPPGLKRARGCRARGSHGATG